MVSSSCSIHCSQKYLKTTNPRARPASASFFDSQLTTPRHDTAEEEGRAAHRRIQSKDESWTKGKEGPCRSIHVAGKTLLGDRILAIPSTFEHRAGRTTCNIELMYMYVHKSIQKTPYKLKLIHICRRKTESNFPTRCYECHVQIAMNVMSKSPFGGRHLSFFKIKLLKIVWKKKSCVVWKECILSLICCSTTLQRRYYMYCTR